MLLDYLNIGTGREDCQDFPCLERVTKIFREDSSSETSASDFQKKVKIELDFETNISQEAFTNKKRRDYFLNPGKPSHESWKSHPMKVGWIYKGRLGRWQEALNKFLIPFWLIRGSNWKIDIIDVLNPKHQDIYVVEICLVQYLWDVPKTLFCNHLIRYYCICFCALDRICSGAIKLISNNVYVQHTCKQQLEQKIFYRTMIHKVQIINN